jgi:hypothetical protein|tara:strand:- start:11801 stop:11920 length:120 start_codon:yes stop_codon:yes gene_type:complete
MTDQEIKDLFDENLNLTLRELSNISGKSVEELKNILMGN